MLVRKGKYAVNRYWRKDGDLHLPEVSKGEEASMGKIQSNRLKAEGKCWKKNKIEKREGISRQE